MGCTASLYAVGRRKKPNIPEVVIHVPPMRSPAQSDLQISLKDGSAISELTRALEEYLSLLIGLTKKENGLEDLVEFNWKSLEDGRHVRLSNSWFELLTVVHMMAILILSVADSLMIPKDHSGSGIRIVSSDCKRDAVDLLLKAAGYLEFCVQEVWFTFQQMSKRFPKGLQDGVLEALSIQALGQGTEVQLGLAVESEKATLSVKRRLA
ncbi:hypothetical protein MANES_04G091001v8 [Manihot esculenta]|uniref:Uncharacterized protein n=1 Tax=Manihot esculenta TaxID=3983 RepID=A0ACB7HVP3_MANES|nr:hypothetical protein MANES_04G091001v8 [Manihot esculenta]